MTERALDPLAGLHECPWCGEPPSPCSTCFECVHDLIASMLRDEPDHVVSALAKGGEPARSWHKRMNDGPAPRIMSPCRPGDVASVAGLTWARRLDATSKTETTTAIMSVAVGLLVAFLVLSLIARLP